ncbi:hypothetical protein AAG570_004957 [Ranatra chinensis]|uniref:F-box domain-containing protein n=1 Tax=Ranatra chinensis TaxID=642074 RepID=A0ABD0Y1J8_9HEMI
MEGRASAAAEAEGVPAGSGSSGLGLDTLPLEVVERLVGLLDDDDLVHCTEVSASWWAALNANSIWKPRCGHCYWTDEALPPYSSQHEDDKGTGQNARGSGNGKFQIGPAGEGACEWRLVFDFHRKLTDGWGERKWRGRYTMAAGGDALPAPVFCLDSDGSTTATGHQDGTLNLWYVEGLSYCLDLIYFSVIALLKQSVLDSLYLVTQHHRERSGLTSTPESTAGTKEVAQAPKHVLREQEAGDDGNWCNEEALGPPRLKGSVRCLLEGLPVLSVRVVSGGCRAVAVQKKLLQVYGHGPAGAGGSGDAVASRLHLVHALSLDMGANDVQMMENVRVLGPRFHSWYMECLRYNQCYSSKRLLFAEAGGRMYATASGSGELHAWGSPDLADGEDGARHSTAEVCAKDEQVRHLLKVPDQHRTTESDPAAVYVVVSTQDAFI